MSLGEKTLQDFWRTWLNGTCHHTLLFPDYPGLYLVVYSSTRLLWQTPINKLNPICTWGRGTRFIACALPSEPQNSSKQVTTPHGQEPTKIPPECLKRGGGHKFRIYQEIPMSSLVFILFSPTAE